MAKTVYLSPSTQDDNIGKGNYGTEEIRMNQITNVIAYHLNRHGVVVYRNNPSMSLRQVVEDSNNKNPDFHFAIHSNAGGGRGCEVFCYKAGEDGEAQAWGIYNELSLITPTGDRGVKQGFNFYGNGVHMYEVAYTNAIAALVEIAFHDNLDDANWIISNIEPIGIALAKGVLKALGISYVNPNPTPPTSKKLYRVMCGSYGIKENAEKRVAELKKLGIEAVIMEVNG
jgi:N-acetylmuramoyl-L-alanine amidase